MGVFSEKDIEIFKRVIKDYETLKKEVDDRIKKGYTLENLSDYIRHLNSCNITNVDLKYIDFNYCDMCISIYQDNREDRPYLGDTIEVWNDEEVGYIGTFNNINEIKKIVDGVQ